MIRWNKYMGFSLLILLGLILAFAPVDSKAPINEDISPLLQEMQHRNYLIDVDELAHMVIDKSPDFAIIDLRSMEDFQKYHISGSIRITLQELVDNATLRQLARQKNLILVSNGNTLAGQAWLILRQQGIENVYILAGGMNRWVTELNNPTPPTEYAGDDEIARYEFRLAAGKALFGDKEVTEAPGKSPRKTAIRPPASRVRQSVVKKFDEGC